MILARCGSVRLGPPVITVKPAPVTFWRFSIILFTNVDFHLISLVTREESAMPNGLPYRHAISASRSAKRSRVPARRKRTNPALMHRVAAIDRGER